MINNIRKIGVHQQGLEIFIINFHACLEDMRVVWVYNYTSLQSRCKRE